MMLGIAVETTVCSSDATAIASSRATVTIRRSASHAFPRRLVPTSRAIAAPSTNASAADTPSDPAMEYSFSFFPVSEQSSTIPARTCSRTDRAHSSGAAKGRGG